MTCEDCLYYERCKKLGIFNTETLSVCEDFTDRSEWIHLPCNVGDPVYKVWYAPCHLGETYPDSFGCDGCEEECTIKKVITEYKVPDLRFIVNELMKDSCVYYFTREEAEKALEISNENT